MYRVCGMAAAAGGRGRDSALSLVASQLPMFRLFKDHQMGEQGQLSAKLYRYLQSETF